MRFGIGLLQYFSAEDGAWSEVTETEVGDSQVTLTGEEAEIVVSYFGKSAIHVGKVGLDPDAAAKTFLLHPDGTPISLNLIFPKPAKPELRLYLSGRQGFKPEPHDIWFVYLKDSMLYIGSASPEQWTKLRTGRQ